MQTADSASAVEDPYSLDVSAFPVSLDSSVESLEDPDSYDSPPGPIYITFFRSKHTTLDKAVFPGKIHVTP